jgi:hypothetical protein
MRAASSLELFIYMSLITFMAGRNPQSQVNAHSGNLWGATSHGVLIRARAKLGLRLFTVPRYFGIVHAS